MARALEAVRQDPEVNSLLWTGKGSELDDAETETLMMELLYAKPEISSYTLLHVRVTKTTVTSEFLTVLFFDSCGFTEEGTSILSAGIAGAKSLIGLHLAHSGFPNNKSLGKLLASCSRLQFLQLYDLDEGVSAGCGEVIAETILPRNSLQKLELSYVDVGREGCLALSKALEQNTSLWHLKLVQVNVDSLVCAEALGKALKHNTGLQELTVLEFFESDTEENASEAREYWFAIIEGALHNKTLRDLNLRIHYEDAYAMEEGMAKKMFEHYLLQNTGLQSVNLPFRDEIAASTWEFTTRNQRMRQNAQIAALAATWCLQRTVLGKDVARMIGKMLYDSRTDLVWDIQFLEPPKKKSKRR